MIDEVTVDGITYPITKVVEKGSRYTYIKFTTTIDDKLHTFSAEYATELYDDLKGIYGLDADEEISNILGFEFAEEIRKYLRENPTHTV